MSEWMNRLRRFDEDWNGLPHKLLTIALMLAGIFLLLYSFAYVAPFALAALFASMIEPVVRFLSKLCGDKKIARNIVSGVFVLLLATVVIVVLFLLLGRIFEEIKTLAIVLPDWIRAVSSAVTAWMEGLDVEWLTFDETTEQMLLRILADLTSMVTSLASRLASTVARVAWQAAGFLPQGILFVVLTLMGTFYMSADKARIFGFVRSLLPEKYRQRSNLLRAGMLRAVFGQLRAAMIMLGITFAELSIGFLLMGMDYAILLALLIAILDALPVIGAGLFLIPMAIYGVVIGNVTLAVGGFLMYLMTIVFRQLVEPRVIGRHLGLHPLATMMAMYAGLKAMGFLGLLLGPLMLLLCKIALTTPIEPAETLNIPPRRLVLSLPGKLRRKKSKQ